MATRACNTQNCKWAASGMACVLVHKKNPSVSKHILRVCFDTHIGNSVTWLVSIVAVRKSPKLLAVVRFHHESPNYGLLV